MWTILLLLSSLLLVAALIVYFLDSHVDKPSKCIQELINCKLSGRSQAKPWSDAIAGEKKGFSSQTCHICGSFQFRGSHFTTCSTVSNKRSQEMLYPQDPLLSLKKQLTAYSKYTFEMLINSAKCDIAKYMSNMFSFICARNLDKAKGESCGSSASAIAPQVGGTEAVNETACISSSPSQVGSVPLQAPSGWPTDSIPQTAILQEYKNTESGLNSAPFRRLVLEILMSPSVTTVDQENKSSSCNAPGLRLKLETSAPLEHLANITNACSLSSDTQKEKDPNATRLLCLPVEAVPKVASVSSDGELLMPVTSADKGPLEIRNGSRDLTVVECTAVTSQSLGDVAGTKALSQGVGRRKFSGQFDHLMCDACGTGPAASCTSSVTKMKHATQNGKLKLKVNSAPDKSMITDLKTDGKQVYLQSSEKSSLLSMDSLGSLCITFMKAENGSSGAVEDSSKSLAQPASALAALNVKSISSKVGGGTGFVPLDMHKGTPKNSCTAQSVVQSSSSSATASEAVGGHGGISCADATTQKFPLQTVTCELYDGETGSSKKRDKKKKKNRGKKAKGNGGSLLLDAQERQEIGKIALEAARHVSAVPEREIGCLCGALKGGSHSHNCPYPFTSSASMLQRKIKEQYDELVKSNAAKTLTLAQVGRFTTCLVEAKASLQQKSEVIQRRFTIAKSLLTKADKSSFDRLCGQIYGLEMEQKKLEEDTVVYNRLQEQLKLSPAYKKMLEYGRAHFELQPHTGQMIEKLEPDGTEMSFEELLAQEKKDSFWQKHGLSRSSIQASGGKDGLVC